MKPRLKKIYGAWHCGWWPHIPKQFLGIGFTPRAAFDDWIAGPRAGAKE